MAEEVLGIQCFVNDVPGFSGVLKHRYADFCVNEVDLEGNVVQLTDLRAPKEVVAAPDVKDLLLPTDFGRQNPVPSAATTRRPTQPAKNDTHPPCAPALSNNVNPPEFGPSASAKTEEDATKVAQDGVEQEAPEDEVSTAVAAFRELAGELDAGKLEALLRAVGAGQAVEPLVLQPDADKVHRTAVHNFFKTRLPMLVTDTVDFKGARCFAPSDGKVPNEVSQKSVRVYLNKKWKKGAEADKGGRKRRNEDAQGGGDKRQKADDIPLDSRGQSGWPKERPKHVRFTLYKENKDSHEAMGLIGKMLGVLPKAFGYAGTKDKRGVTVQHVTLHRVSAERLAALNPRLFSIQVGNSTYVPEGLSLGQLSGNQFAITLRSVPLESQEHAVAAAQGLQQHGFINYFGLQRFGTGSVRTHEIGAALLKGSFQAAVDLLLRPRAEERADAAAARAYFARTRDAGGTLAKMPHYMNAERSLLQRLRTAPHDWVGALACIPRTLRMMYVHAYQSFLWNHAATHRIMLYGAERAVEGDLVFEGEQGAVAPATGPSSEGEPIGEDTVDADVPASHRVKHVTKDEAEAGAYSIADVLLPLPGAATQYPQHETAGVYADVAAQHGVNLQKCAHNVKEYSIAYLTGGYRKLLQKPRDMEWQLIRYSDPDQPLWPTAIDRIAAQPKAPTWLARFRQNKASDSGQAGDEQTDVLTALRKSFVVVRGGIASEQEGAASVSGKQGERVGGAVQPDGNEEAKSEAGNSATEASQMPQTAAAQAEGDGSGEPSTTVVATEALKGVEKEGVGAQRAEAEGAPGSKEKDTALGAHLALQIKMTLPSSCYATMAIRELLKTSTAKDFHKDLQKESNK